MLQVIQELPSHLEAQIGNHNHNTVSTYSYLSYIVSLVNSVRSFVTDFSGSSSVLGSFSFATADAMIRSGVTTTPTTVTGTSIGATSYTGGNETRPFNYSIYYIIKT